MTEFLLKDFKSFEDQLITYIQTYYNLLTEDVIDLKTTEGKNALTNYIINNTTPSQYIKAFLEKQKFEFNTHIAIVQLLFEKYQSELKQIQNDSIKKKQCLESIFSIQMTKVIYKEIINYRNYLAHEHYISDEHIQRIYEDEYFYLHYINLPIMRNILSEYSIKQLKLNIKNILAVNLTKDQSFSLYYQGYKKLVPEMIDYSNDINKSRQYLKENELIEMYTSYIPKKLFDFEYLNTGKFDREESRSDIKRESEEKESEITVNNNTLNFGNDTELSICHNYTDNNKDNSILGEVSHLQINQCNQSHQSNNNKQNQSLNEEDDSNINENDL